MALDIQAIGDEILPTVLGLALGELVSSGHATTAQAAAIQAGIIAVFDVSVNFKVAAAVAAATPAPAVAAATPAPAIAPKTS